MTSRINPVTYVFSSTYKLLVKLLAVSLRIFLLIIKFLMSLIKILTVGMVGAILISLGKA